MENKNIDSILKYLPYFKNRSNKFYRIDKEQIMDPYIYSRKVRDFIKSIYKENFTVVFDYPRWQMQALKYYKDSKLLKSADIITLRKLLTLHIRKDRFVSGHLVEMIDSGHILKILKRLKEIRDTIRD